MDNTVNGVIDGTMDDTVGQWTDNKRENRWFSSGILWNNVQIMDLTM